MLPSYFVFYKGRGGSVDMAAGYGLDTQVVRVAAP
jgi:hypothetical protein